MTLEVIVSIVLVYSVGSGDIDMLLWWFLPLKLKPSLNVDEGARETEKDFSGSSALSRCLSKLIC